MAVQHTQAVQQLSSAPRRTESCPSVIGPISLEVKQMGARSAGNPHAACDVEGAGNAARLGCPALPARQPSTLLMSEDGKRGDGQRPKPPRPSSTLPKRTSAGAPPQNLSLELYPSAFS